MWADDDPDSEKIIATNAGPLEDAPTDDMEWPSLQRIEKDTNDETGPVKQPNHKDGRTDDKQVHSEHQAINRKTLAQTDIREGLTRKKMSLDKSSDHLL